MEKTHKPKTAALLLFAELILGAFACPSHGANAFTEVPCNIPGVRNGNIAWGDFDNDGFLDVLIAGETDKGPAIGIYRNDGCGNFTPVETRWPGLSGAVCNWVDYNGDGFLDVAVTSNSPTGRVSQVYLNNHDGTFTLNRGGDGLVPADRDHEVQDLPNPQLAWGDYDNDGKCDVVMGSVPDTRPAQPLRLYHKTSGPSGYDVPVQLGLLNGTAAWADTDNDGLLDLIAAGKTAHSRDAIKFFKNMGHGTLKPARLPIANFSDAALAWADFDNDGDLDLIVTGRLGKRLVTKLYINNAAFANVPPTPPTDLRSAVSGETVTLSWAPGSDLNQHGGLTYNLRIGSAPGTADIIPCLAEATSGLRRVPRIGNVNEQFTWSASLPEGKYYWSVQSIDHSFAGSEFAVEQTFDVPARSVAATQNSEPQTVFFTPVLNEAAQSAGNSPAVAPPTATPTNNLPPTASVTNTSGATAMMTNSPSGALLPALRLAPAKVASLPACWIGIDANRKLYLSGAPSQTYSIEASSDLLHWTSIGSIQAENGPISFYDPDKSEYAVRFYRAVLQMPIKMAPSKPTESGN